jgi:hypothetical protein
MIVDKQYLVKFLTAVRDEYLALMVKEDTMSG